MEIGRQSVEVVVDLMLCRRQNGARVCYPRGSELFWIFPAVPAFFVYRTIDSGGSR
jgi:hypothetical protein